MYGWRARIALLIPSPNTTAEPEFNKMAPEGISIHIERMFHVLSDKEDLNEYIAMMNKDMIRAVISLATIKPDLIVYTCTGGSMLEEPDYYLKQSKLIFQKTGIRSITTTAAVIEALKKLRVKKLSVATPYVDKLNEFEKSVLEKNGFQVLNIKGLGLWSTSIGEKYPSEAYRLAKEVDLPEADAVFISCTNFRTIEIIETLEKDFKKPVITSNQATLWYSLRNLGISEPIEGYGRLLLL